MAVEAGCKEKGFNDEEVERLQGISPEGAKALLVGIHSGPRGFGTGRGESYWAGGFLREHLRAAVARAGPRFYLGELGPVPIADVAERGSPPLSEEGRYVGVISSEPARDSRGCEERKGEVEGSETVSDKADSDFQLEAEENDSEKEVARVRSATGARGVPRKKKREVTSKGAGLKIAGGRPGVSYAVLYAHVAVRSASLPHSMLVEIGERELLLRGYVNMERALWVFAKAFYEAQNGTHLRMIVVSVAKQPEGSTIESVVRPDPDGPDRREVLVFEKTDNVVREIMDPSRASGFLGPGDITPELAEALEWIILNAPRKLRGSPRDYEGTLSLVEGRNDLEEGHEISIPAIVRNVERKGKIRDGEGEQKDQYEATMAPFSSKSSTQAVRATFALLSAPVALSNTLVTYACFSMSPAAMR